MPSLCSHRRHPFGDDPAHERARPPPAPPIPVEPLLLDFTRPPAPRMILPTATLSAPLEEVEEDDEDDEEFVSDDSMLFARRRLVLIKE